MTTSYWLDASSPGEAREALSGYVEADVAIAGAGYTGLWTAVHLRQRDPGLHVVVCEADRVGGGASGRNGGFCDPSLTHGLANGVRHFGNEIGELERLAARNYAGLLAFLDRHDLDCDFEATGMLDVATEPWQVGELREQSALYARFGQHAELLDTDATRDQLDSPRFLAGLHRPHAGGVLDPAKLARGLARVAAEQGVALYERTPVRRLVRRGSGISVQTPAGEVRARHVVVATNAYSAPLLAATRRHFIPVYDYVLVTEPLTGEQLARVGWQQRQGVADSGNRFHYFRLLASDNRILWGGYDAVYYYGNGVGAHLDQRPATFAALEAHFRETFPQLADVAFTHRWGGAIATTTRFTPVFGQAMDGRVHFALGYTGLGVTATRFAGQVLATRIVEPDAALLRLRYVSTAAFPFPPEPLRWATVTLVRRALARADRRQGRRGPVLAMLDRAGIGLDS